MNLKFGDKVIFKNQDEVSPGLKGKEFCLLGMCDCAYALIEWDKKGGYDIHFYSGNPNNDLKRADWKWKNA